MRYPHATPRGPRRETRDDMPMNRKTLASVDALAAAGLISSTPQLRAVEARYSVAVTPDLVDLIGGAGQGVEVARQFLPAVEELVTTDAERADPIGDDVHSPLPGLVHRYPDRVLLKLLSVCPVYCRFCFRRESVGRGKGDLLPAEAVAAALDYIAARPQIFEVILTGGDPLMLSARRLAAVGARLAAIGHVRLLRVHTRAPTAAPALIDDARLAALASSGKAMHMALHVNHASELTRAARAAIERLRAAGWSLLSQTVLLAGVNDNADVLAALMRELVSLRIKPYYLHHPDLAPGTGHFRLPLERGRALYAELAGRIAGHALPRYVLDIPGGFGKVPIDSDHVVRENGVWRVRDRYGVEHEYPGA